MTLQNIAHDHADGRVASRVIRPIDIKRGRVRPPQLRLGFVEEEALVVDNFAGGGGASHGIERALGKIDIAINHNEEALAVHKANHPNTQHYIEDVWSVDPRIVTKGHPVRLAWFSPDCTHHSKARGSKPVKKHIRGLAWVVIRWASSVMPHTICLENVEEFKDWGPVIPKVDDKGNQLFDRMGEPLMVPDPKKKGVTFRCFVEQLRGLGYTVDWRELKACDYGAPTIRNRLFLIARCDGNPIVWPEVTHGEEAGLIPYRTGAECINWSIQTPSIFTRKKPLVPNTMKRIANGIRKFVLESDSPYIIGADKKSAAYVIKHFTGVIGAPVTKPFPTILSSGTQNQIVIASLIRHFGQSIGQPVDKPMPTIVAGGNGKTGVVTSHLIKLRGTCRHGQRVDKPIPTITAGGLHIGEVRTMLEKYSRAPTSADPFVKKYGLGVLSLNNEIYRIADIGMRMLSPRELFKAQGFHDDYIIDPEYNGKPITKTAQYRLVGNSVSPEVAEAIVLANCTNNNQVRMVANG